MRGIVSKVTAKEIGQKDRHDGVAGIEYKRNDGNPCNRAEKLNEESSSQLRQKRAGGAANSVGQTSGQQRR